MKYLTLSIRLLLGATFLISGFLKGVDPHGTEYKIVDYLQAWDLEQLFPVFFALVASCVLSAYEFFLGICLLLRLKTKSVTLLAFLTMVVMTLITLWLALTDAVADCGCFGDALKLSNWQTFIKNIVLLVFTVFLLVKTSRYDEVNSWKRVTCAIFGVLFILCIETYSLYYLPIFDFRPYSVGSDIRQGMLIPTNAEKARYETKLLFEKSGDTRYFTTENYPDSSWHFVKTEIELISEGYKPPIHDFSIVSLNTGVDITDKVLSAKSIYLLVISDVKTVSEVNMEKVNFLYQCCHHDGVPFIALTASLEKDILKWKNDGKADYCFYHTDPTTLKTMIRSNPGLILLNNGKVSAKWSIHNLPILY